MIKCSLGLCFMLLQAIATPLNRKSRQQKVLNQVVVQPSYSWVSSADHPFTQPLAEYNIPTWATQPQRHRTGPQRHHTGPMLPQVIFWVFLMNFACCQTQK